MRSFSVADGGTANYRLGICNIAMNAAEFRHILLLEFGSLSLYGLSIQFRAVPDALSAEQQQGMEE